MRRLLHLLNYAPLGTRAMDHFILEYARQARDRGWSTHFGFRAEPPPSFAQSLREQSASWLCYDPLTFQGVSTIAPVDVVQSSFHSVFEKPLLRLKTNGFARRLVVIDHSSGEGPSPIGWKSWLRRLRGRWVGGIVDAIVCVSEFNRRRDVERVFLPKEKVRVVPNGIDLERFPYGERTISDSPVIVYAGQLIAEKGVLTLLQAIKNPHTGDAPAFDVLIAGAGPQQAELADYARRHAINATFLGHVADVPALFRKSDVAVIPSLWAEAFGLVAIEAMASGAAVIASDAGALPEVVADAGLLFPRGDVVELARQIRLLTGNSGLRQQLSRKGRVRVEEHYQLRDCIRRHLDIVEEFGP